MAKPWRHPRTGRWYLRRQVPVELRPILGHEIKRSLMTADKVEARRRFATMNAWAERLLSAARSQLADQHGEEQAEARAAVLEDHLSPGWLHWHETGRDGPEPHLWRPETPPKVRRELLPDAQPAVPMSALMAAWEAERRPPEATVAACRRDCLSLARHLGHPSLATLDAAALSRRAVVSWKDSLLETRKARTVATMLGRAAAVLSLAVANSRLPVNPMAGVKVHRRSAPGSERRGYSTDEAARMLTAAEQAGGASSWLALLLYWTGARIGEVAHLREQDIRQEPTAGWCVSIEAHSERGIKTASSQRLVPLHREITSRSDFGPDHVAGLLGSLKADRYGSRQPAASRLMVNLMAAAGVQQDGRLSPAHSFRHSFRTRCRDAGVLAEVADAITGHQPGTVSGRYGGVTLAALRRAIDLL